MPSPPDASTVFALALLRLDGVGRVTARRLFEHFEHYDDLRGYSREQVFLRIKGAPNAEQTAARLFDAEQMRAPLDEASEALQALAGRGVRVLTPRSAAWPSGLGDLDPGTRPFLLYAHGDPAVLQAPPVALLARPPLEEAPFERAQALAAHLAERGRPLALGAQSGFDVALAKRTASRTPVVLVAACGLAKLPRRLRPAASQAVRAGGLLLSPFPMAHGPFDHDDHERARVQTALAGACVFVPPPPETPEAGALDWALEHGRPAFVLGDDAPEGARPVRGEGDFGAVRVA